MSSLCAATDRLEDKIVRTVSEREAGTRPSTIVKEFGATHQESQVRKAVRDLIDQGRLEVGLDWSLQAKR